MEYEGHGEAGQRTEQTHIEMPAPTFWPMVLAFGLALLLGGLVTNFVVSLVGLVIAIRSAIGWWRDVIPLEKHEQVAIEHRAHVRIDPSCPLRRRLGRRLAGSRTAALWARRRRHTCGGGARGPSGALR